MLLYWYDDKDVVTNYDNYDIDRDGVDGDVDDQE